MWPSEQYIKLISQVNFRGEDKCAICSNDLPNVRTRRQTGKLQYHDIREHDTFVTACQHTFHTKCLRRWLSTPNGISCPICRYQLRPSKQQLLALKHFIHSIQRFLEFIDHDAQHMWWDFGPMDENSSFFDDVNWIESNENMCVEGLDLLFQNDRLRDFNRQHPEFSMNGEMIISAMYTFIEVRKFDRTLL